MPKLNLTAKKFSITSTFNAELASKITTDTTVAPGQLRLNGEWFGLTFLQSFKYDTFNIVSWSYEDKIVDSIRIAEFRIYKDKILIKGSKREMDEIQTYLQTLILATLSTTDVDFNQYFSITDLDVEFENFVQKLEEKNDIETIKKVKMKQVEIILGEIKNAVVVITDYGAARKAITEEGEIVIGVDVKLKTKAKTTVYIGSTGAVKIKSQSAEVNLENTVLELLDLI